jgi:hypothetical protein
MNVIQSEENLMAVAAAYTTDHLYECRIPGFPGNDIYGLYNARTDHEPVASMMGLCICTRYADCDSAYPTRFKTGLDALLRLIDFRTQKKYVYA